MMSFCDCQTDGFCQRYNRMMAGRLRQICQGVNVDLGTAAVFREEWAREANWVNRRAGPPKPLLLKMDQAVGDAVVMTAAIYSLHKKYPGKYLTAVESPFPEVFQFNPDVSNNLKSGGVDEAFDFAQAAEVRMHYPAIHQCNERGIHFMQGWCEFLGMVLGIDLPLMTNKPHLYFETPNPPVGDYWVICSGGKKDFTNKLWGYDNYQKVVNILKEEIIFVQVGASEEEHPELKGENVSNAVGITQLRNLFNIVRRARGVICGVSLLMHVAAALEKPAIVIAGGREPVQWNAYPKQQYLHTVGMLPCSDNHGVVGNACWRARTIPLGDGTLLDQSICLRPIGDTPECMTMITPAEVVDKILRYNQSGGS